MARSLARLAFETAVEPPAGGYIHADPPVETPKHAERPSNARVAGGIGVVSVRYPRAYQHSDVDARGLVVRGGQRGYGVTRRGRVRPVDEKNGVVIGGV